ncbi:MAG: IS91 family transposase [Thermodesulfobacteriota bacterium]|nr:IS91 family transposase [Thermodesulfobacteriota bacterium]
MKKTEIDTPNNRVQWEVADIFRLYGDTYRQSNALPYEQIKVMHHIEVCRTAELGGHVEQCDQCGFEQIAYNSCRDRHCPKCQCLVKEQWLNDRKAELLPCGYFHFVFTLPHDLNPIILCNKKITLQILFSAVSKTLQAFAKDPQWRLEGQLGFIAVLHTWSQTLMDHFHLHCLIAAGALSFAKDTWTPARESFLFRIESLAKEFKKRYLQSLKSAYQNEKLIFPGNTVRYQSQQEFEKLVQSLSKVQWIAYAKRPFAGPEQVLEYLGRYTHRVAISNNRILSIDNGKVTFTYRDRENNETREMSLDANEFIRRFLMHVLPRGFMKIRYFGFLSHKNKKQAIPLLRKLIDPNTKLPEKINETIFEMMLRLTGTDITCCPKCKKGKMKMIRKLPTHYLNSP